MPNQKRKEPPSSQISGATSPKKVKISIDDKEIEKRIKEMGQKCENSIQQYRNISWTEYARNAGTMVSHNFGNGLEDAVKCFGCRRLLPPVLITGDHIVPKSVKTKLRKTIAYQFDQLDQNLYEAVVDMPISGIRNHTLSQWVNTIKKYDLTLEKDVRNIQPLCWYCNSVKGPRFNVNPTSWRKNLIPMISAG
jgi:hypothetical protein